MPFFIKKLCSFLRLGAGKMAITVCGFDMTSAPCRRKPITCATCRLGKDTLALVALEPLESVAAFRQRLEDARECCTSADFGVSIESGVSADSCRGSGGPGGQEKTQKTAGAACVRAESVHEWIAGLDFPFGQARAFLDEAGWPIVWEAYVRHAARLSKEAFAQVVYGVMEKRAKGSKLIRRITDVAANAISPMSLAYVPVGRMFHVLAPVIEASGATIVPVRMDGDGRVLLEAYPALLARAVLGTRPYKDGPSNQQKQRSEHRAVLIESLPEYVRRTAGLELVVPSSMAALMRDDPRGDYLDALLCAIQAAHARSLPDWGILHGAIKGGGPANLAVIQQTEGWIVGTKSS